MENAHTRHIMQRTVGIVGSLFFLVPGGVLSAAILYGADAHEKTYTTTLSESATSVHDWEVLGDHVFGIFLSIDDLTTGKPATPEILILPCIKGSRCVTVSIQEDTPVKGILSFLRPTHTLSIDGESADALTGATSSLCAQKKSAATRYRITHEIVSEATVETTVLTGTCTAGTPKGSELAAFSVRGSITN